MQERPLIAPYMILRCLAVGSGMSVVYLLFLLSLYTGEFYVYFTFVIAFFAIMLSVAFGIGLLTAFLITLVVSIPRLTSWAKMKPGAVSICFGLGSMFVWLPFFGSIHAVAIHYLRLSQGLE